jgi:hypothetical protein
VNSSLGLDCQIQTSTGLRSPDLAIQREHEMFNIFLTTTKILKILSILSIFLTLIVTTQVTGTFSSKDEFVLEI